MLLCVPESFTVRSGKDTMQYSTENFNGCNITFHHPLKYRRENYVLYRMSKMCKRLGGCIGSCCFTNLEYLVDLLAVNCITLNKSTTYYKKNLSISSKMWKFRNCHETASFWIWCVYEAVTLCSVPYIDACSHWLLPFKKCCIALLIGLHIYL